MKLIFAVLYVLYINFLFVSVVYVCNFRFYTPKALQSCQIQFFFENNFSKSAPIGTR